MYSIDTMTSLNLGEQGEHLANEIRVDMSSWVDEDNTLRFYIVALRHAETNPYIAATTMEDNILVWPVTSADTGITGAGLATFVATDGTRIKKSKRIKTIVGEVIPGTDSDTPPDPASGWVERVINTVQSLTEDAQAAKADAESAAEHAESVTEGIDQAGAAQIQAVQAKGDEVINSIPADYSALTNEVTSLKSALIDRTLYTTNDPTDLTWTAGLGINSVGKVGSVANSICTNPRGIYLYADSAITSKPGYLYSVAFWRVPPTSDASTSNRISFGRNKSAGVITTVPEDCYVLISAIAEDSSAIPDGMTAAEFAASALSVTLHYDEVKTKVESASTMANAVQNQFNTRNTDFDTLSRHVVWAENIAVIDGAVSGRLENDGTIAESTSYNVSVFFPIKPDTEYINRTSNTKILFYDYSKNVITYISPGASGTFTTPSNAVYARISTNASIGSWQINEGTTLLDYSRGHLPLLIADELSEPSKYYKGDLEIYPANISGWYEVINTDYSSHDFSHTTKYADIIALFDALMAFDGEYATKESIGTAEGTDADGNPYTIYAYTFKSRTKTASKKTVKPPKIMMDASIHGFEKNSTYALYTLCYDLVHNWANTPYLAEIHNHVELKIVPVSNPWGFDNDSRNNANAINLNRNFPSKNWQLITPSESASDASGLTGPLDQAEAQALANWIQANTDALIYFNIHTNGHYYAKSYSEANYCMISADNTDEYYCRMFDAICRHLEDQTAFLSSEFEIVTPNSNQFVGTLHTASDGSDEEGDEPLTGVIRGTVKQYVSSYLGVALSMTFELFNGLQQNDVTIFGVHTASGIKACAEILSDMIAKILVEYSD